MSEKTSKEKGSLLVVTGSGKGKTTSALGMSLRAAGHGLKVCFIQFIKGAWTTGEAASLKKLNDLIEFHVMGDGFTWKSRDLEKDKKKADKAFSLAVKAIESGDYFMVVLDEITYPLQYGMIDLDECLETLSRIPSGTTVVVTGRDAPKPVLEMADMISEINEVRHHYKQGVKARKGIEF